MILKTAFSSTILEKQTVLGSAYMEDVKREREVIVHKRQTSETASADVLTSTGTPEPTSLWEALPSWTHGLTGL